MITLPTSIPSSWRFERLAAMRPFVVPLLLYAAIGIELMVIVAWMPDTLRAWWSATDVGDFRGFYENAAASRPGGSYSPAMALLMRPLTWFSMETAFRIFTGINIAATLGVAYLAQRNARTIEARVAIALGVLALPMAHWALRVGHFPMLLALFALGGFMLTERRPVVAGILFAMLALKPQYLPIPILFLLWTKNWRALGGATGTFLVLSIVGLVMVGIEPFFTQLNQLVHTGVDQGKNYFPGQQSWQYSWQGVLISMGIEPNPLIVIDLLILSLGAVIVVWAKTTVATAKVAAALGMLLLAPWSTFYNWSIIAVAAALLLQSDIRPKALVPIILGAGAIAIGVTMKATPYPSPNLLIGGTNGIYWLPPFALATVFLLAIAGRRRADSPAEEETPPLTSQPRWALRMPEQRLPGLAGKMPRPALALSAVTIALAAGYMLSAFMSQNGPFQPDRSPFARQLILNALPLDFPIPQGATVEETGRGTLLPYRLVWETDASTSEVASLLRKQLDDGSWEILLSDGDDDTLKIRMNRLADDGQIDLFGDVQVTESGNGSMIALEFILMPIDRVPGFNEWLEDREEEPSE